MGMQAGLRGQQTAWTNNKVHVPSWHRADSSRQSMSPHGSSACIAPMPGKWQKGLLACAMAVLLQLPSCLSIPSHPCRCPLSHCVCRLHPAVGPGSKHSPPQCKDPWS